MRRHKVNLLGFVLGIITLLFVYALSMLITLQIIHI